MNVREVKFLTQGHQARYRHTCPVKQDVKYCEIMLSTLHSVGAFLDPISVSLPLDGNGLEFVFFLHPFQNVMKVVMFGLFIPNVGLNVSAGVIDGLGLIALLCRTFVSSGAFYREQQADP